MTADEVAKDIVDASCMLFSWRAGALGVLFPAARKAIFKEFALMTAPRGYDVSALSH
jgi:hypothetical protein